MLRRALPLAAPPTLALPKERLISPRELRVFMGWPKQRQWKALLKRAGVTLRWAEHKPGQGRERWRCGLNRAQVLRVMRTRYSELGEQRIRRWKLG